MVLRSTSIVVSILASLVLRVAVASAADESIPDVVCPAPVPGTHSISSADGSILFGSFSVQRRYKGAPAAHSQSPSGPMPSFSWAGALIGTTPGTAITEYSAIAGHVLPAAWGGSGSCTWSPGPPQSCWVCVDSGSTGNVYAGYGTFSGSVYSVPDVPLPTTLDVRPRWLEGAAISPDFRVTTDGQQRSAFYSGRRIGAGALFDANPKWWVTVKAPGDVRGISGNGTYELTAQAFATSTVPGCTVTAQTSSNFDQAQDVPFCHPYVELDESQARGGCDDDQAPDVDTGLPVNVTAGNVWFDHVDATLPGPGQDIVFRRSYNSILWNNEQSGVFGSGWNHSYERRLRAYGTTALAYRGSDGIPQYYVDNDGDGLFTADLPRSVKATVERRANGTYVRHSNAGSGVFEEFDSSGRLLAIGDGSSGRVTLEHDGLGRLVRIRSGSRFLELRYEHPTSLQLPTSLHGPAGVIVTYEYTVYGLARATYSDGDADGSSDAGYEYVHETQLGGAIATVKDGLGRVLEHHEYQNVDIPGYAGRDRLRARTSERAGGIEKLTYSYERNATTVVDALGNTTRYEFASRHRLPQRLLVKRVGVGCAECGQQSSVETWEYDERGRVSAHTDADGKTVISWNDAERIRTITSPLGHESRTQYDAAGRIIEETSANGAVRASTYSAAGMLAQTHPSSASTVYEASYYEGSGLLQSVGDGQRAPATMTYTADGDLETVTYPENATWTYAIDLASRQETKTDPQSRVTRYKRDSVGRVVEMIHPDGAATRWKYQQWRLVRHEPAGGVPVEFEYDESGRRIADRELLGDADPPTVRLTSYQYDAMSNLIGVTNALGRTTTYVFERNRLREVHQPVGSGESPRIAVVKYDDKGRVVEAHNASGLVKALAYDAIGRLTEAKGSDGSPEYRYTWDENGDVGFMTSVVRGEWRTDFDYDLSGELLDVATSHASRSELGWRVHYENTPAGDLKSINTSRLDGSDGLLAEYVPGERGRPIAVRFRGLEVGLGWDDLLRLETVQFPSGVGTAFGWNDRSWMRSVLTTRQGGGAVFAATYELEDNGSVAWRTENGVRSDYSYDPLDRLTAIEIAGEPARRFVYDALSNRRDASAPESSQYNERNELLAIPGVSFEYDHDGRLVRKTDGSGEWAYKWDFDGKLIEVTHQGSVVSQYEYDGTGRRVLARSGGSEHVYAYHGTAVVADLRVGGGAEHIVLANEQVPLARTAGDQVRFLHTDRLGSIVRETDADGATTRSTRYDEFGQLIGGDQPAGRGFAGLLWDAPTRLYYAGARFYDPAIGRFISPDPDGPGDSLNLYEYAHSNPLKLWDSNGRAGMGWGTKPPTRPKNLPDQGQEVNAYIVCQDGELVPIQDSPADPCVAECWRRHEDSHIKDMKAAGKNCKDVPEDEARGFDDNLQRAESEATAWGVEKGCLKSALASGKLTGPGGETIKCNPRACSDADSNAEAYEKAWKRQAEKERAKRAKKR